MCTTKMLGRGFVGWGVGVENQREHARALSILLIAAPERMLEHFRNTEYTRRGRIWGASPARRRVGRGNARWGEKYLGHTLMRSGGRGTHLDSRPSV